MVNLLRVFTNLQHGERVQVAPGIYGLIATVRVAQWSWTVRLSQSTIDTHPAEEVAAVLAARIEETLQRLRAIKTKESSK
jgi:preprotein translocase subunit YajC